MWFSLASAYCIVVVNKFFFFFLQPPTSPAVFYLDICWGIPQNCPYFPNDRPNLTRLFWPLLFRAVKTIHLFRLFDCEFTKTASSYSIAKCTIIDSRLNGIRIFHLLFVCDPQLTSCRRAAATICPAPLLPLWAPKCLAPPSTQQRSSFPRQIRSHAHRCSCLTR